MKPTIAPLLLMGLIQVAVTGQFTTYRYTIEVTYVNPCHLIKTLDCPEKRVQAIKDPGNMHSGCLSNFHWNALYEDCDRLFKATWQDAVEEINYCIPKNIRPKRSALVPVVELLGTVTTNLLKSKMERANSGNYEAVRDRVYNEIVQKTELQAEMQQSILKELNLVSSASRNHQELLEQMSAQFPVNVWTVATINRKLITMTSDLKTVRKECLKRQVATLELGELFGSAEIARMDPQETYVEELAADPFNYHMRIIFTYRNGSTTLLPMNKSTTNNTTKIDVKRVKDRQDITEVKENFNVIFFLILNFGLGAMLLLMVACHLFRNKAKDATVDVRWDNEASSIRDRPTIWE